MTDDYPDDKDLYEYTASVGAHTTGDRVSLTPPEAEERGDVLRPVGEEERKEIRREAQSLDGDDPDRQTHYVEYLQPYGAHQKGDRTWVTPKRFQQLQEDGVVRKIRVEHPDTDDREQLREEVRRANLSELDYNELYSAASDVADAIEAELPGRSSEDCLDFLVEHYRDLTRLIDEGEVDTELDE